MVGWACVVAPVLRKTVSQWINTRRRCPSGICFNWSCAHCNKQSRVYILFWLTAQIPRRKSDNWIADRNKNVKYAQHARLICWLIPLCVAQDDYQLVRSMLSIRPDIFIFIFQSDVWGWPLWRIEMCSYISQLCHSHHRCDLLFTTPPHQRVMIDCRTAGGRVLCEGFLLVGSCVHAE